MAVGMADICGFDHMVNVMGRRHKSIPWFIAYDIYRLLLYCTVGSMVFCGTNLNILF